MTTPGEHPNWLNDDEQAAWRKLARLVELLPGILDSQLQHDAQLTHFEYFTMAMLSEAPKRVLRMTELSHRTNATLPRLSHVVSRLEQRGYIERFQCDEDRRATNARLTDQGWQKVLATAPGHVATVQQAVIEPLTADDIADFDRVLGKILARTDSTRADAASSDARNRPGITG